MRRAARFLLYTLRPYLLILPTAATGAALLLPRIAGGTDGPAAALCNALPGFGLLFLLMLGMNLALSALPLALSLGGRRRDLLLGVQLCALLGAGAAVLPWLLPLPAPGTGPDSLWLGSSGGASGLPLWTVDAPLPAVRRPALLRRSAPAHVSVARLPADPCLSRCVGGSAPAPASGPARGSGPAGASAVPRHDSAL